MTDPTTLLDLGGITTEPTDTSVPLLATTWTHPGLPGRTIVRLTAEPLARAEELSLEVTGFAPGPRTPVGHTRRRAIGFPAWPIIHDPANAHHALNIVADLERMARTARSKPGFAKDQVDAMVSTLDATAPHYLPTLLEEAGRIFGRLDNTTYATQMFSKAREAERRHNLTIDPERHREVFLEFAYAGALPVKELTAEAARLADHPDPARAYADFRTLCVERTRGGLAPYANMAKDLRKLARAAGLDQVAEDRALVADLLAAPVIGKAGPHFWKAYDKAIGQLAGSDPAARERLLTLTPEAFGVEEWLERLERWGATDHVVADTDLAFFHRMVDWLQTFGGWRTEVQPAPRLEAFAASLAPALIAAGEPLTFREARLWAVPADLLDRFAELGLPLTIDGDPGFYCRIELSDWAQQDQRRDLTHLAGVAALRAPLEAGFERAYAEHGAELARAAGTRPLVLAKLAKAAEATATRPVTLMTLTTAWKVLVEPVAAVDDPEIRTTIRRIHAQVDAGEVLADNLRLGTLAELAWPAAEAAYAEAVAALPPQPHSLFSRGPQLALSWPDLVIEGAHAALVCGETRRTFVAPVPNATIEDVVSVGADTALRWREESTWNLVWAWDRDPARTFEASRDYVAWDERVALNASLVTEHGRLFAAGLMRPGEDGWKSAQTGNVLHDGRDYWAATATQVVELDPASGQPGRASLPDWFAEIAARHPGHTLRPGACQLHLVTPDTAGSLVSTADGFHRSALLESGDEVLVVAADGATYPLDPDEVTTSTALVVERPGGGTWLLAGGNNDLIDPETGQTLFPPPEDVAVLHPKQLPVLAFHHARVRDEAASTWLRQATVEEANAIVDAVADAINATPEAADDEETLARYAAASTAAVRPWVADDALAAAVAWMTSTVIGVTDLLELAGDADAGDTDAAADDPPEETAIADHHELLLGPVGDRWGQPSLTEVLLAGRLLGLRTTGPTDLDLGENWRYRSSWGSYVGREAALLMVAATPGNSADAVRACQHFWRALREAGFLDHDLDLAVVTYPANLQPPFHHTVRRRLAEGIAAIEGGRDLVASTVGPLAEVELDGNRLILNEPLPPVGTRADLDAVFDALADAAAREPRAYDPDWGARLAELTGLPLVDAHLLAAGLPGMGSTEHNFLPRQLRTQLKLKVAEAAQARERLREHTALWPRLLAVAVPADDPMRLLTDGPDIDAMAELWLAEVGAKPSLSPELLAIKPTSVPDALIHELLTGTSDEFVQHNSEWAYLAARTGLWLAWNLPADSPLRTGLSDAFARMRGAIRLFPRRYRLGAAHDGSVRTLLGLPQRVENQPDGTHTIGALTVDGTNQWSDEVFVVPSALTGPDDADIALTAAVCDTIGSGHEILFLVADGFAPWVEAVRPMERPGAVQDPRVTVPDLVTEAAETHGISADAAAYHLQLLALAAPTDRNVQTWNGWTKKQREAAGAELLAKELVVEGKRARAGRRLFLPGGWMTLDSPQVPMETWKMPWHPVWIPHGSKGRVRIPGMPALLPPAQLFTAAWARSRGDDRPGFGELQTNRKGLL